MQIKSIFVILLCIGLYTPYRIVPIVKQISSNDVCFHNNTQPRLLIKWPTRSRPDLFFKNLKRFYHHLSHKIPVHFVISCDIDDKTMNCPKSINKFKQFPNLSYYFGNNNGKISACNADVDKHIDDFDIILLASDDMYPVTKGFDLVIAENMQKFFPTGNGVLNFYDGHAGEEIITYSIMDNKYYRQFGFLYNPVYKSLCSDNEFTAIAKLLQKERYVHQTLLEHRHPAWGGNDATKMDELYRHNDSFHDEDKVTFWTRRDHNFYMQTSQIKWSILIPTLDSRKKTFSSLLTQLEQQIQKNCLEDKIEIVFFRDNTDLSVGTKRNALVADCTGEYISFIDDDDKISEDYIEIIYKAILNNPDCVSLTGHYFVNNKFDKPFIHSIKYKKYSDDKKAYYRPPNHLNPIKKSIACKFAFPELSYAEDTPWAMQICNSGLLKKEIKIKK
ncbi:MAG: glycosyltransferase family 2 protein, partial [Bdellovibrionales bacterium]|nr:glycosyltransferase family 2 protein [Bdellovibrionales bacterium]